MPQSLRRTWALLAVAALAVLVVASLTLQDFVRDIYADCSASIVPLPGYTATGELDLVVLDSATPPAGTGARSFALRFDEKKSAHSYGGASEYSNVRVAMNDIGRDGRACTCGSLSVVLRSEGPSDLRLYRETATGAYVVKGRFSNDYEETDMRGAFMVQPLRSRQLQTDRIFTQHHIPVLVTVLAMGALVVALFRSRRAMSYALRLHAWTEGRLTIEGVIESESGTPLGTLEHLGIGRLAPGPILVAPDAIPGGSLYRDMPIIPRSDVAEGTHERWTRGTMVRLRDARALAILSTACTILAFGAWMIA